MIIETIHTHMEENRQTLENKLFKNETDTLDAVLNSL